MEPERVVVIRLAREAYGAASVRSGWRSSFGQDVAHVADHSVGADH